MAIETLLIIFLVGLIAGGLAGQFVKGASFGLIGDIIVGVIGALIGGLLLPRLGAHFGSDLITAIVSATIGAVALMVILRFVRMV